METRLRLVDSSTSLHKCRTARCCSVCTLHRAFSAIAPLKRAKRILILNPDALLLCNGGLLSKRRNLRLYKHADILILAYVLFPSPDHYFFISSSLLTRTSYFYRCEDLSRLLGYETSAKQQWHRERDARTKEETLMTGSLSPESKHAS